MANDEHTPPPIAQELIDCLDRMQLIRDAFNFVMEKGGYVVVTRGDGKKGLMEVPPTPEDYEVFAQEHIIGGKAEHVRPLLKMIEHALYEEDDDAGNQIIRICDMIDKLEADAKASGMDLYDWAAHYYQGAVPSIGIGRA
jgi:hypothetical protein